MLRFLRLRRGRRGENGTVSVRGIQLRCHQCAESRIFLPDLQHTYQTHSNTMAQRAHQLSIRARFCDVAVCIERC